MYIPEFDDSSFPIGVGSPLRAPKSSWHNWGIVYAQNEESAVVDMSEAEFRKLLRDAEKRMKDISAAATAGCFGDYPKMINDAAAGVVADSISSTKSRLKLLDIGAGSGNTSYTLANRLQKSDLDRIEFYLSDPEGSGREYAEKRLAGLKHSFTTCSDTEYSRIFDEETFDIAISVASFNNHSDLIRPFRSVHKILKKGGLLVIADWHSPLPGHPKYVREFLDMFSWETKNDDMHRFTATYPKSEDDLPPLSAGDNQAKESMKSFWVSYMQRNPDRKKKGILKGHRPVEMYVSDLKNNGYEVEYDPIQVLPNSRLLMVTVARKA